MPTYDYRCDACEHTFEAFESITAEPIKICPVCSKKKVRRLIGSGGGLIFKGSGFYCTDYRDSSYKASAKSEKTSSASTPKTSDTGSAEKTSPKTESKN